MSLRRISLHTHSSPSIRTSSSKPIMSSARYERLPTSPEQSALPPNGRSTTSFDIDEEAHIGRTPPPTSRVVFARDPRFDLPTPPKWQRVALVVFVMFLFWLGFRLRGRLVEEGIPSLLD